MRAVAEDREWPSYSPEKLLPAYRHHASRLVAAFRAPGVMDRPMVILAGPLTAAFCVQIAISERFVHAWDLAAATGQSFDEGADIAEALLASPEYVSVNSEVRLNTPPPLGPELAVESGAGLSSASWRSSVATRARRGVELSAEAGASDSPQNVLYGVELWSLPATGPRAKTTDLALKSLGNSGARVLQDQRPYYRGRSEDLC